jgi:O-antigen ligase
LFSTTHIVGATYWGYKAWDDPKRKAGRLKDVGGPDTQNENQAAAHLLTVIPFVAAYTLSVKRRWLQMLILGCGAFIVNCFILCNSRGATLALMGMVCAAIILVGKGRRVKLIGLALAGLVGLYSLSDSTFIERQQTTLKAKDGSAQSRFEFWAAGVAVIKDYPLGGGGRAFHILSPKYVPELVARAEGERSVHNTFLALGTEWGIQGMILWFGFIGSTFIILWKSRLRARDQPWYYYRFLAIELSLIGTMIYGMFGTRLYGEGVYWMCALAVSLQRMHASGYVPGAPDVPPSAVETPATVHAAASTN